MTLQDLRLAIAAVPSLRRVQIGVGHDLDAVWAFVAIIQSLKKEREALA